MQRKGGAAVTIIRPDGSRTVEYVEAEPEFGISQRELARMCGLSRAAIRHVEKRAMRKIREEIQRQAAAAGVSPIEWLFGIEREVAHG